jgi:hypothetical protein
LGKVSNLVPLAEICTLNTIPLEEFTLLFFAGSSVI